MAKSNMDQDILKVLYSEEQLKTRVQEMGDELYERLKGKNPLFLGVLKGSFIFMADIVRACQLKSDIEFIAVSSYQNATTSSGVVQITRDLQQDITGRDIVVIEDILDSGNTLYFLKNYFMTKGASSVTVVTLLDKPARRTKPIAADLAGFEVPDEFVVGYGLGDQVKVIDGPLAGFYGGIWDTIIMRCADIFLAFPYVLFVVAMIAVISSAALRMSRAP